jgi:hypothetical protein
MKLITVLPLLVITGLIACKKGSVSNNPPTPPTNNKLSYGDSIFYLKGASYTVTPVNPKPGTYTAFPDNLTIDNATGIVTVTLKGKDGESQTGLKYKIKFTSNTNEIDSTYITISGVNYIDRFYNLSKNDSIIYPIYNADISKELPQGSFSGDNKLAINSTNGQINVKETIRRGFFDNQINTSWKQTTIRYTANDKSNSASNTMDIILYYYNSVNDIPSNVSALMQAHQRMALGVNAPQVPNTTAPVDNKLSSDLSLFKPRPPCIVIVGQ